MKKVMMMIALLAIPFAMQAQTKFRQVNYYNDDGHVTHHRVHRRR